MSIVKVPFGLQTNKHGESLIFINDAKNGLGCDCVCPGCLQPLMAIHGQVNAPHFRHVSDGSQGNHGGEGGMGCLESAIHKAAKQILSEAGHMTLAPASQTESFSTPKAKGFAEEISVSIPLQRVRIEQVTLEKTVSGEFRPDAEVRVEGVSELLYVEFCVTHKVDKKKKRRIKSTGLWVVEIDLSSYLELKQWSKEDLEKSVLHDVDRQVWHYNPELERQLQAKRSAARRKIIGMRNAANKLLDSPQGLMEAKNPVHKPIEGADVKESLNPYELSSIEFKHMTGRQARHWNTQFKEPHPDAFHLRQILIDYESPNNIFGRLGIIDIQPCFRYWEAPPFNTLATLIWILKYKQIDSVDAFVEQISWFVNKNKLMKPSLVRAWNEHLTPRDKNELEMVINAERIVFEKLTARMEAINYEIDRCYAI